MAEKIVDIKGITGGNQGSQTAMNGITSVDLEKLQNSIEKRADSMQNLIASVSSSSIQSTAKMYNVLQSLYTSTTNQNKFIISYLSGFQSVLFGYMEGLQNSMYRMIKNTDLQKTIQIVSEPVESEPLILTNPYRQLAQMVLDKVVVDNQSAISTMNVKEVINTMTHRDVLQPNPVVDSIHQLLLDTYTLFDLFTDDWSVKQQILINNQSKLQQSIDRFVTKESVPIYVTSVQEGVPSPISDSFETRLFQYLEALSKPQENQAGATRFGGLQTVQQVNYSGTISVREIVELLQRSTFYNPVQVEIFKKSFTGIANAIAGGISTLTSSIKNKADVINSTTSMLTAISNIVSERVEATTGLEVFGSKLLSFTRTVNPWSTRNVTTFVKGFQSTVQSINVGMELINAMPIDEDKIKNTLDVVNSLSELLAGEDKTVNIKIFGNLVTKIYAFTEKNAKRFGDAWKIITDSLQSGFRTLNSLTVPDSKLVKDSLEVVTSIMSLIHIKDIENLSTGFRGSFIKIIDNLSESLEVINQMPKPDTKKLRYVTDATTIIRQLLETVSPKHILQALSLRMMLSAGLKSIVTALDELSKVKTITKTQERTIFVLNAISQTVTNIVELKNFKPKKLSILVSSINTMMDALSGLEKAGSRMEKGTNVFCNSITKITETMSGENMKTGKNIKMLASGIALLGLSLVAFALLSPVVLVASLGLLAFGFALKHMTNTRALKDIALFTLSLATLGISIWAFSEIVNVDSLGKTVMGLAMLAGAIWLFSGKGSKLFGVQTSGQAPVKTMMTVALGLATLGLSVWLWEKLNLGWNAVGQVAAGIVMLAGATWAYSKVKDVAVTKMIGVSLGIGTLGLAIWAWQTLDIKAETFAILGLGLAGLAGATFIYQKVQQKSLLLMAGTAIAVGLLGASVALWQYFGVGGATAISVGLGVAALGVSSMVFTAVPLTAGLTMGLIGLGIAALGFGVSQFKDVTTEQLIQVGLFTTGIGLASYLFANPLAMVGAASMLAVGISVAALAVGMKIMVDAGIDETRTKQFVQSISAVCMGYAALAIPAIAAAATSVLLLPVVGTTVLLAGSLALVMAINYQPNKITQFNESVKLLTDGYDSLSLITLGKTAIKAGLLLPLTATTYLVAGAIALISSIPIQLTAIQQYGLGMNSLVQSYDKLGLVSLVKANAKAIAMLPLATVTIGVALAIRTVQALDIDGQKLRSNAQAMGVFVTELVTVFESAGDKVLKVKKGIWAVGDLASTVKSLADAVFMVASMEYTENEIRNGKIVPKQIRKLTDKDFTNVGVGIAKMLTALIDPLITIGSTQDTYTIGGITIQNPFGSGNKVQRGIKALSGITEIFTPLAATVQALAEAGVTGKDGDDAIKKLNLSIGTLVTGISDMITKISTIDVKDSKGVKKLIGTIVTILDPIQNIIKTISETGILAEDNKEGASKLSSVLTSIVDTITHTLTKLSGIKDTKSIKVVTKDLSSLFTTLAKADATGLESIRKELDLIVAQLSNEKPWSRFKDNLISYEGTVARIKNSINQVDLEKAIVLKDLAQHMNEANDNDNIERLIVELQRLIDKVQTNTDVVTEQITTTTENQQTIINTNKVDGKPVPGQQVTPKQSQSSMDSIMAQLSAEIRKLVTTMSRPLLVQQKTGDTWSVTTN